MAEWRKSREYDNYEVSNAGQVRNALTQPILKSSINRGYQQVGLSHNGKKKTFKVHKLVATAFLGDSEGREVDHIDRDAKNNRVENLRYVTRSENQRNKTKRGNVIYEYIKELPEGAEPLGTYYRKTDSETCEFEHYYFFSDNIYYYNGIEYRKIRRQEDQRLGYYARAETTAGHSVNIYFNTYKQQHNI
jgi:hypothetical protein